MGFLKNKFNKFKVYALIDETIKGRMNQVADYIKTGVDINGTDQEGNTALMFAASYGYFNIAKLLLDNKADPNIENFTEGYTPIFDAIRNSHLDVVKLLIKYGADLTITDNLGNTPLLVSIYKNSSNEIISALIEGNSDVNYRNIIDGFYPIIVASIHGNYEICKKLIEYGASKHVVDDNGVTPLKYALDRNDLKLMELLETYMPRTKKQEEEKSRKAEEEKKNREEAERKRREEEGSKRSEEEELQGHIPKMVDVGSFKIGKYPVTFAQYDYYCEETGKEKPEDQGWGRGNRPAINVSWYDAVEYCKWLSNKTGKRFRLPTETEWEYAAKGGSRSRGYEYSGSNNLDEVGWYWGNSGRKTQPVGIKDPNEIGIHDMTGNVVEWCKDRFEGDKKQRVLRGSWNYHGVVCRVSDRNGLYPSLSVDLIGFRVAQDP